MPCNTINTVPRLLLLAEFWAANLAQWRRIFICHCAYSSPFPHLMIFGLIYARFQYTEGHTGSAPTSSLSYGAFQHTNQVFSSRHKTGETAWPMDHLRFVRLKPRLSVLIMVGLATCCQWSPLRSYDMVHNADECRHSARTLRPFSKQRSIGKEGLEFPSISLALPR